ncbi:MAG: phosphate regulon transcriptional regulator PhoB [Gammaproteobacteria bacterium]|nr:phosphate regulon transcriptional regulator PhoB [Gammaproteobacteria bacterium]MBT8134072.1 phosphate regulon transcriptional regulator PhoB [Gammaproteobacteria bacterium]NNJ50275.1 phosphate regulon transcriptional regulator PhoB [Gammaproteobacteria bacterium]
MKHANILVVEDDAGIQDMLKYSLSAEGYTLFHAYTVKEGWEIIEHKAIDLVLLDWMLPDNSGIDLLHRIRKYHSMLPVIMVTAKTEEEDRILGLDVGADDYVSKPFSVRELNARIQALLRRAMPDEQPLQIGELYLDPASHRVRVTDTALDLSPTEFRLLHYFMSHTDRVFTRAQLLDQVWGSQVYVEERTVDVHIRRLRKQLAPFELDSLLQTVHGSGYRFSRHN